MVHLQLLGTFFFAQPKLKLNLVECTLKPIFQMAYQLDLEAWDEDVKGNDTLIERQTETKMLPPSSQWATRRHDGSTALIEYKIKVECDQNYYGPACSNNCEARNDYHGHYKCSQNGEKICLPFWKGPHCTEPICASGCHPEHGYCEVAGECR